MKIEPERVVFLVILAICGILMAAAGNYIMDSRQPVRQESQLLENYLLMQSMAGKNTTPSNFTIVAGSSGLVVSFNDILTNSGIQVNRSPKGPNTS
ncbi:MAG: hypothetical protein CVV33_02300 [Methanomicrobiales archaeon HGW-Methanomicrobiales-4]|nr:MAG: hypothetical protein CVV33_02300 [Methanomicrobiales archaeon HGW-Methanomicrobiales-4]